MWNAALQSTITVGASVQVAVGQAFAGQHQVWEIVRREPGHSTAGSTRVCVKPEETGPKRRNKFARHERPLKSQAIRPETDRLRYFMERSLLRGVVKNDAQPIH